MSVPEPVPEVVAFYIRPVLQLQYESTAMERQFPSLSGVATLRPGVNLSFATAASSVSNSMPILELNS